MSAVSQGHFFANFRGSQLQEVLHRIEDRLCLLGERGLLDLRTLLPRKPDFLQFVR